MIIIIKKLFASVIFQCKLILNMYRLISHIEAYYSQTAIHRRQYRLLQKILV